jgi:hypothetical protein
VTGETRSTAVVERVGVDLDDTVGLPLRSYKTLTGVIPQASFDADASTFTWEFGSADLPTSDVVYRSTTNFDPATDYKIDTKVSGRYLAYRVSTDSLENFKITGFDATVYSTSKR